MHGLDFLFAVNRFVTGLSGLSRFLLIFFACFISWIVSCCSCLSRSFNCELVTSLAKRMSTHSERESFYPLWQMLSNFVTLDAEYNAISDEGVVETSTEIARLGQRAELCDISRDGLVVPLISTVELVPFVCFPDGELVKGCDDGLKVSLLNVG